MGHVAAGPPDERRKAIRPVPGSEPATGSEPANRRRPAADRRLLCAESANRRGAVTLQGSRRRVDAGRSPLSCACRSVHVRQLPFGHARSPQLPAVAAGGHPERDFRGKAPGRDADLRKPNSRRRVRSQIPEIEPTSRRGGRAGGRSGKAMPFLTTVRVEPGVPARCGATTAPPGHCSLRTTSDTP